MAYLVTFHWGWLLAALLLGLAMGWIAVVSSRPGRIEANHAVARRVGGGAGRGGAGARDPGRPGYWLDLGLIMFAMYLVGCAVGSWLRDRALSRHAPAA